MNKEFDVICIGAGPGGYVSAIKASQSGKRVAVIDISKEKVGGVCLNEGCIPTKAIIHSSEIYANIKKYSQFFGFGAKINKPDMKQLLVFNREVVEELRKGIFYLFKKYGVTFIEGKAILNSPKEINLELKEGGRETLKAKDIILATGSRPQELTGMEFDKKRIISSSQAIKLDYIPESILIVGAGAIGIEFGSLFNNLGTRVSIVEAEKNILPNQDLDISKSLKHNFKKRKIDIYNESRIIEVDKQKGLLRAKVDTPGGKKELDVELILVAVGRIPSTDFQDFSKVGIEVKKGNFLKVDNYMRTTADNVYAIGDIANRKMLAHIAYEQAQIAVMTLCGKKPPPINLLNIPTIVYCDIQVASVGLTEEEVKRQGFNYLVSRQYFRSNSSSVINRQIDGFVKIIADKKTHQFLGIHILGFEASEIIHQFVVAKSGGLLVDDMAKFVYGHPTFSEIAKDACLSVFNKPIHG